MICHLLLALFTLAPSATFSGPRQGQIPPPPPAPAESAPQPAVPTPQPAAPTPQPTAPTAAPAPQPVASVRQPEAPAPLPTPPALRPAAKAPKPAAPSPELAPKPTAGAASPDAKTPGAQGGASFNCAAYEATEPVFKSCVAASKAYFDDIAFSSAFRERSFEWQLWSSKIAFWLMMGIVAAGLGFSGVQMGVGLKSPETKFSFLGLEVSSSIVGLVILAMSVTFFYLYLVYVYPISQVG
jgi:hypothetical protein